MGPRLTIKDSAWEFMVLRSRVVIAMVLVVCMTLVLVGRLVHLQVIDYDHFRTLSHENRVKVVPVAPTRGLIFDRNGTPIAENDAAISLEILPEAVDDMEAMMSRLGELVTIREVDQRRFHRLVQSKPQFEYIPLRTRLSEQEVARFAVNRHRFPGVDIHARLRREYSLGELGSHLIGYVGRISERELKRVDSANYWGTDYIGKTGVEEAYEDVLHGTVGYEHVETNAQGRRLRVLERKPPQPGRNLHLTIDMGLQAVAEAALRGERGAVVALEPATGDVLAFASMPGFDPNLFAGGIEPGTYRMLLRSQARPLFNRALYGRYPPGSTIKPVVALAGLQHDVDLAHESVFCPGWFRLQGSTHKYRDWKKWGHGETDLSKAIVESCDVYFYQLALALGIRGLHDFMGAFGLGKPTGIDLEGEAEGLNPSPEWKRRARGQPWYPGETLITGIGQGFTLATPLQLASVAATLANRGQRMKPRVVDRLEDPESEAEEVIAPEPGATIEGVDDAHWRTVVAAMEDVVHGTRGTARRIGQEVSYRIAGKTGTAQVVSIPQDEEEREEEELDKHLQDHALFISFAPVDEPRIAVAVVVENGGSGSKTAAPIAREVMDYYLLRDSDGAGDSDLLLTAAEEGGE